MRDSNVLRHILRSDLASFHQCTFRQSEPGKTFSPNWHYEHLAWKLAGVLRGDIPRLIVNVPPRSGKSLLASVSFPMFALGQDSAKRIMCISHTEELARTFALSRRAIALSPWYKALFPDTILSASRPREMEFATTRRGGCFGFGVGGGILGRGADIIILDDPSKATDSFSKASRRRVAEFFDNTVITRLDEKRKGAIVIVMQRLAQDDLVGHVCETGDWEVVQIPALATDDAAYQLSDEPRDVYVRRAGEVLDPRRDRLEDLEAIRRAQGSLVFEAQYQQNPVPAGGNVIRRDWLRYYQNPPARFDRIVVSWDTASTIGERRDWSVGTVWGALGLDYYLLDVHRARLEAPDLRQAIIGLSQDYEADATIIEDTELGRALAADIRRTGPIRPLLHPPRPDKEARLLAQAARFEAGQVRLPADAPWLGAYVDELLAFPSGRHDDQVDSTSQALNWLTARTPQPAGLTQRRNIPRR